MVILVEEGRVTPVVGAVGVVVTLVEEGKVIQVVGAVAIQVGPVGVVVILVGEGRVIQVVGHQPVITLSVLGEEGGGLCMGQQRPQPKQKQLLNLPNIPLPLIPPLLLSMLLLLLL